MLRLVRRHQSGCKYTSETDRRCQCPIHIKGIDRNGQRVRESLGIRNWTLASEMLLEREAGKTEEAPPVTVAKAVESFRQFKSGMSIDTQRKAKLLTGRLLAFLAGGNIADVKLDDLSAFRATWTGKASTRSRDQQVLKSFFKYCLSAEYITKNPAIYLDTIKSNRAKTDPFADAELNSIFTALPQLTDEYGRKGGDIARQTQAFVLVMKYTGLAIGDVASLEKSAVHGCSILTSRKKTNEEVYCSVPQFVIDTLMSAPHDSPKYFFWTGAGKLHTRTSKWGDRLRKLFKLAGVPHATPHMFRHTFARAHLQRGGSMSGLAELHAQ